MRNVPLLQTGTLLLWLYLHYDFANYCMLDSLNSLFTIDLFKVIFLLSCPSYYILHKPTHIFLEQLV